MNKKKKEKPPKSFAEIIKEHNKLCRAMLSKANDMYSEANKAFKNGDHKKSERLVKKAEKYLELVDETMEEFDASYKKTLKLL